MRNVALGIYGTGGSGREIMAFADDLVRRLGGSPDDVIFIDDNPQSELCNGRAVFTLDGYREMPAKKHFAIPAVGAGAIRQKMATRCSEHGIELPVLVADTAIVQSDVTIGDGSVVCPFTVIASNVQIGSLFQANFHCHVAHDCRLGDRVTFAPGAIANGNVKIDDDVYVGAGAVIRNGVPGKPLTIGRGATIGMGAVVTRDVAPGETVAGNPARTLPAGENERRHEQR